MHPLVLLVQQVRPHGGGAGVAAERRWYGGSLAAGIPQVGQEIVVLPSGTHSRIAAVEGNAPAVRVQLEHELDVSRGDVIADAYGRSAGIRGDGEGQGVLSKLRRGTSCAAAREPAFKNDFITRD